jgi:cGMP-dependent protein kinase
VLLNYLLVQICDDKQQQHILREKLIMASCDSPFVVKLYRTYRDARYLYMLMEPCLGGELWTILRNSTRFQDPAARFYTACVIKALEYLHDKGILYRDLKPENLLLDASGYVKLTDFGFSKQLAGPEEKSWTFCGTPEYVAPEIITNKSHDFRADIWSVGILMYELLTGAPPFTKKNNASAQVYVDILKGMKAVCFPAWMSASSVELIRQLCRLNPAQRPGLAVTRRYMWFAGFDWEALERRTLAPPFTPKIDGCLDSSNFDNYVEEQVEPEEDFSDWDSTF